MISRVQFIDAARTFRNVPFRHQGRSRSGLDCWGVIVVTCQSVGIACPDDLHYQMNVPYTLLLKGMEAAGIEKPVEQIKPGDLVLLACGGTELHSGIVGCWASGLTLISASRVIRRVSERLLDVGTVAHVYEHREMRS
jgi:cell wall-associated NlpC family hydrolase